MNQENVINLKIRETIRRDIEEGRWAQRNFQNDSIRRGLGEIYDIVSENITTKDVQGLATRIKRKKHASPTDLIRLSNAFLQSFDNISVFIKIQGAINIIIKEFTSSDSELQVWASECLCNLSLGDEICCEKVALYAGSYLLTYSTSTNKRLSRTCLWVLSNLVACGEKPLKILLSQEIVLKLLSLIQNDFDEDVKLESYTCLDLIVSYGNEIISSLDFNSLVQTITSLQKNSVSNMQLLYKLLAANNFNIEDVELLSRILQTCTTILVAFDSAQRKNDVSSKENTLSALYSIRTITNIISTDETSMVKFIEGFQINNLSLTEVLNRIFAITSEPVVKELLWLVGTIHNNRHPLVQNYLSIDKLTFNLRIPKYNLL